MEKLRAIRVVSPFGLLAFITGFVLMTYEMVASRLLAPSIGTSTYIWTSVIGSIIAALAVGYAVGGRLADRRTQQIDLAWLLLACATAITGTLLSYPSVLELGGQLIEDLRLRALFDVTILFVPASFLMGVISPYLTRLSIRSLNTTGRAVANLSALNSIGGISGTFVTGFIFFSTIGSRETLILLALVLVVSSWIVVPKTHIGIRLIASSAVGLIAWLAALSLDTSSVAARIDTPSAHYVVVEGIYNTRPIRALMSGPSGWQSAAYNDDSDDLVLAYTQAVADIIAAAPAKDSILILGGGAFSLPQYLGNAHPSSAIDVIEIDPQLEMIAETYFQYSPPANVSVFFEDARTYLATTTKQYDLIVVDVYNDISIPFSLATHEYVAALHDATKLAGTVIVNVVAAESSACSPLMASLDASYRTQFSHAKYSQVQPLPVNIKQNLIATYSNQDLQWVTAVTPPIAIQQPKGGRQLTDNFAPVEYLQQQCFGP